MSTERNKELMKKFETMINTADELLAEELVDANASFYTPASPEPLYGGKGYLSVVYWMRSGFSDVQWKLEEMIAENDKVEPTTANLWGLNLPERNFLHLL